MAKYTPKLLCVPFINGNLDGAPNTFNTSNLTDAERERVYKERKLEIERKFGRYEYYEVWKPNEEIEMTLRYKSHDVKNNSVTLYWENENGNMFPMFFSDFIKLLEEDKLRAEIHGIFTYVKRGSRYGIKLIK